MRRQDCSVDTPIEPLSSAAVLVKQIMDEEGIEQSEIRADHLQWRLPYLEAVFPLVPECSPEGFLPDRV